MKYTHDVIIIGAGIAGSAMALALCAQGLRVALLDKQKPVTVTSEINLRVSNINYSSEQFLNTLGVNFPNDRRGIFKQIKVFQQDSINSLNFYAAKLGLPYLGSIIENNVLIEIMQHLLSSQPLVTCMYEITAQKFTINQTSASVEIPQMGLITAPLIIGAEGAHSALRQHCDILQEQKDYGQIALVAHIQCEKPHQAIAYQRFLKSGPLAYLPLHDAHQCSIVWSSVPSHIDDLLHLDDNTFNHEVSHGLLRELGDVKVISKRASFPLMMRHAKHYIAPRVALIGDTIHTLHPLAGQGANLGLKDVACLAAVIKEAKEKGRDYGQYGELRSFERKRRLSNTLMLQAMQVLAMNQPPFTGLRGLGIQYLEKSAFLKKLMMEFAQKA